jgi:hypothetical protein
LIKCKSTDKEDRKQFINTIYSKLRRFAQGNALPEQAFRTEISKNAHIEKRQIMP